MLPDSNIEKQLWMRNDCGEKKPFQNDLNSAQNFKDANKLATKNISNWVEITEYCQ